MGRLAIFENANRELFWNLAQLLLEANTGWLVFGLSPIATVREPLCTKTLYTLGRGIFIAMLTSTARADFK